MMPRIGLPSRARPAPFAERLALQIVRRRLRFFSNVGRAANRAPAGGVESSTITAEFRGRFVTSFGSARMTRWFVLILCLALASSPACSRYADLKQAARITDVTTGWFDAGVTPDGKNKLVPSISFHVRNAGDRPLGSVQMNLLFKRVTDKEEWTTSFVRGVGPQGLAPGATTPSIVVRAQQGYTGTQARISMLQNAQFIDFKVEIFGKQGATTWVKLGEFPIERQLLTH
jgi:hypothetical protein